MNKSRRSFLEGRRKSLVLDQLFDHGSPAQERLAKESETLTLQQYFDTLKREKSQWKEIHQAGKKQLKESINKLEKKPLLIEEPEVESTLTQEDKDFLAAKPDYVQMLDFARHYMNAIMYMHYYKSDVVDSYDKVVRHTERNIQQVFDKLSLDDKVCEVCNISNCQMTSHCFQL